LNTSETQSLNMDGILLFDGDDDEGEERAFLYDKAARLVIERG